MSYLEELVVEVLRGANRPLSLDEIVSAIIKNNENVLTGRTPKKSLYSIIYRREKRRAERGHRKLFIISNNRNIRMFSLDHKPPENIGKEIR